MPKITVEHTRDVSEVTVSPGEQVVRVISVEAEHVSGIGAVIPVRIELHGNPRSLVLPLPPPAAMQLARDLRRAVRDYLNSVETESRSEADQN